MLIFILVVLLVLGITFYQAIHGFYSAIIMAILTACCTVIAFNYYEPLAEMLYENQPTHADAAALTALFVLPLLGLRMGFDRLFRGNVVLGTWADRIGGAAAGFVTAVLCVGVLTIAMRMLPWNGASIGGWTEYDELLGTAKAGPMHSLDPGTATLKFVNMLSRGSMKADPQKDIGDLHDHLMLELFCARNTGKDEKGEDLAGSTFAMPGCISVTGVYLPPPGADYPDWKQAPSYPVENFGPTKVLIVRCTIDQAGKVTDPDNFIRLPATHFRLVTNENKSCYPVGYLTYLLPTDTKFTQRKDKTAWDIQNAPNQPAGGPAAVGALTVVRNKPFENPLQKDKPKQKFTVDWVYQVPAGETPAYLVFRRSAKCDVPAVSVNKFPPVEDALTRTAR